MKELTKNILFIGGKGGVGKTTTAAAIALKLAKSGHRTLLVSTDPAHSLGDIFDKKIGGKTTNIMGKLFALEIDPEIETTNYINRVKENIKGTVHGKMMEEVHRQLDTARASPGADEAALFDKLVSIIIEERTNFDRLVFDTAPTGHTIRLLSLPELMGVWIEGLLQRRKKTNKNYVQLLNDGEPIEDPIFDVLQARRERFEKVREVLLDHQETGYIFVLNPERLPITETQKAIELLDKYHLHVKTLIVNKVLPEEIDGKFFTQRKYQETQYLSMIKRTFKNQELIFVPFFAEDITKEEQLDKISSYY